MFLPSRDGIVCDFCGDTYKDEFIYYSVQTTEHIVKNNIKVSVQDARFDKDMCTNCFEEIKSTVMKHLGPHQKTKVKCDLSNAYKGGTFNYYVLIFDEIKVDKKAVEENQVSVNRKVIDLNVINGFDKLLKKTEVIKSKVKEQGVWS